MTLDEALNMTLDDIILGSLPSAADVRYGVNRGDGTPGACHVPGAVDVRKGVEVDVSGAGTLEVYGLLKLTPR